LHTITGTAMSRAYSNAARHSASSFFMVTTPQLSSVMPACLNFSTTAFRSSVDDFSGRWMSLIEQ
jgi:hypothetical protein